MVFSVSVGVSSLSRAATGFFVPLTQGLGVFCQILLKYQELKKDLKGWGEKKRKNNTPPVSADLQSLAKLAPALP